MIKTYISTLLAALMTLICSAQARAEMDRIHSQLDETDMASSSQSAEASTEEALNQSMVETLLDNGIKQYKAGFFEESIRIFDAVLALDKYNKSAALYMKRASESLSANADKNSKVLRAHALAEVTAGWTVPPMEIAADADAVFEAEENESESAEMESRLRAVQIPVFDVTEATIAQVVKFFASVSRAQDNDGEDIDFLLVGMESAPSEGNITISVDNISLYEALQYVVEMASLKFSIAGDLVVVMPVNYVPATKMVVSSYNIIPDVGMDMVASIGQSGNDGTGGSSVDVTEFFSLVDFPEGSSAVFSPRFNKLFVRNTADNIRAIEVMLDDLNEKALMRSSMQVEIEAKFVEFTSGALDELGFDWTIHSSGSVAGFEMVEGVNFQKTFAFQRGSLSRLQIQPKGNINSADDRFIYQNPVTAYREINDDRIATNQPKPAQAQNLFGGSQRDNTSAFGVTDKIDETEVGREGYQTARYPTPRRGSGVTGTMGGGPAAIILSNGDIDLRIAAMEQQGTADILAAPSVKTKSGTEASIRVAETHRYPQDYVVITGQRTAPAVRPQSWQELDMGVSLKVTPEVDPESNTIALDLRPTVMVFQGYEDYLVGLNVFDSGGNNSFDSEGGDGRPLFARIPYYDRRDIETKVTVSDGSTVVLGGLVDEKKETFRDQIPFLGDIPYLGRLFRTEGSRTVKKDLTIFVKATRVDARGMSTADRELARY